MVCFLLWYVFYCGSYLNAIFTSINLYGVHLIVINVIYAYLHRRTQLTSPLIYLDTFYSDSPVLLYTILSYPMIERDVSTRHDIAYGRGGGGGGGPLPGRPGAG